MEAPPIRPGRVRSMIRWYEDLAAGRVDVRTNNTNPTAEWHLVQRNDRNDRRRSSSRCVWHLVEENPRLVPRKIYVNGVSYVPRRRVSNRSGRRNRDDAAAADIYGPGNVATAGDMDTDNVHQTPSTSFVAPSGARYIISIERTSPPPSRSESPTMELSKPEPTTLESPPLEPPMPEPPMPGPPMPKTPMPGTPPPYLAGSSPLIPRRAQWRQPLLPEVPPTSEPPMLGPLLPFHRRPSQRRPHLPSNMPPSLEPPRLEPPRLEPPRSEPPMLGMPPPFQGCSSPMIPRRVQWRPPLPPMTPPIPRTPRIPHGYLLSSCPVTRPESQAEKSPPSY